MKKYLILYFLVIGVVFTSCKPELDSFEPSAGDVDFSNYVALGNSLTSGYTDGELFKSGQENSYPNLIAKQLGYVGGGEFKQPLMVDEIGFGGKRVLSISVPKNCDGTPVAGGTPSLAPVLFSSISPTPINPANMASIAAAGPYHNLGVPGAKVGHLLFDAYGTLNPYFARFASNPANTSIVKQAVAMNPSFFSLWIGNNDILSYSTSGGEGEPITEVGAFTGAYKLILDAMTANGAKGVLANIPDVTSVPFFTTIPYNALVLTTEQQVQGLNQAYAPLGITFTMGQNGFIIRDAAVPGGLRKMKQGELLLLTLSQDSIRCKGWGSATPIPDKYVLDETEIAAIQTATNTFNNVIKNFADQYNLAFVDANAFMKQAKSGFVYDGMRFNAAFVTGGIFALDGIHLSARGNAITANQFIDAINKKYNAKVPLVDVGDYPGIVFP